MIRVRSNKFRFSGIEANNHRGLCYTFPQQWSVFAHQKAHILK